MTKDVEISDASEDKKYFTIIPNYVYNHSTHWDREVYCQMKRIAGENGVCWTSQKTLAKKCGLSINRLKKSLKYLIEHGWITFIGIKEVQTKGGSQETNQYSIANLWKRNADFYESKGVSSEDIPTAQRGVTSAPKGVSPEDGKEEPYIKKNKEETSSSEIPLLLKEFESINPAVKRMYGNKTQREACADLIKQYTLQRLQLIIQKTLPKTNGLAYFPTITTPAQLRDKFITLESAIRKHQSETKTKKYQII